MGNFKQRLKRNSVLKIFVEKFRCCWKIREALVDYGSKRHIIIYPYTASWVATIWLAAAIKANYDQLTSMEKKKLLWKLQVRTIRPEVFYSEEFRKIHVKHLRRSLFFNKTAGH